MPKYRFVCTNCGEEKVQYVSLKVESFPCGKCDSSMLRQLPSSGSQKVLEVVDSYNNVKHTPDHEKELKDRKTEYFWDVEVPRLIQTYSLQTCLEEKWLVYNDKGELVVNKPPSKR